MGLGESHEAKQSTLTVAGRTTQRRGATDGHGEHPGGLPARQSRCHGSQGGEAAELRQAQMQQPLPAGPFGGRGTNDRVTKLLQRSGKRKRGAAGSCVWGTRILFLL